jgi:hypothetical protein
MVSCWWPAAHLRRCLPLPHRGEGVSGSKPWELRPGTIANRLTWVASGLAVYGRQLVPPWGQYGPIPWDRPSPGPPRADLGGLAFTLYWRSPKDCLFDPCVWVCAHTRLEIICD